MDADPDDIDYLVPGNDKAKKSIEWFFGTVEKAIEEGMAMKAARGRGTPDEAEDAKSRKKTV